MTETEKKIDISPKKISEDELRASMQAKIAAIPVPKLSKKQKDAIKQKNDQLDRENLDHTIKILHERRQEAINDGDQSKKYDTIQVERTERDNFNVRNQLRELEIEYNAAKKTFTEETWTLLSTFSELNDPKYWERAKKNGFTDQDVALYYRDVWGINPKSVVKFLATLKIKKKMEEIEKLLI